MKYKFSSKQSAVRNRVKNLPQIFEKSIRSARRKEAEEYAKTFEQGIKNRELNLAPLKPETIKRKRSQGMAKPSTPLFGRGQFSEMMQVTQQGEKWVVKPKRGKHHSGLTYAAILEIHEKGKTIKRKTKSGKAVTIRIQPRPSKSRAYQLWLRRRKKVDTNRQVWKEINQRIKTGKSYELSNK